MIKQWYANIEKLIANVKYKMSKNYGKIGK